MWKSLENDRVKIRYLKHQRSYRLRAEADQAIMHKPVLLKEVINYLNLSPNKNIIDCTFGAGRHSSVILDKIKPSGRLLGIDLDQEAGNWKRETGNKKQEAGNLILINDNFRKLRKIVEKNFPYPVHGILLDLGLSSEQLEKSGRGFSFQKDEPLDMRFDVSQQLTAAEILNSYSLEKLKNIFKNYGELKQTNRFVEMIVQARKGIKKSAFVPQNCGTTADKRRNREIKKLVGDESLAGKIKTTYQLMDVLGLSREVRYKNHRKLKNPAYQIFQALRIAVNDELTNLAQVLPQAVEILQPGGRLAVVSFHSLEDRIVKNFFRQESRMENPRLRVLTKKPVVPLVEEVAENPRSRSAKMRCAEKIF